MGRLVGVTRWVGKARRQATMENVLRFSELEAAWGGVAAVMVVVVVVLLPLLLGITTALRS